MNRESIVNEPEVTGDRLVHYSLPDTPRGPVCRNPRRSVCAPATGGHATKRLPQSIGPRSTGRRAPTAGRPSSDATSARKILIAGGNYSTPFIRYMATLTGQKRPTLLSSYRSCAPIDVYPLVQESFIASSRQTRSWQAVERVLEPEMIE